MAYKLIVRNTGNWNYLENVKKVFATHPKFSNACTGFLTFSIGDVIAQKMERDGKKSVDFKRSLKLGALGFVMNGFFLYKWFAYLDKMVGTCMITTSNVAYKVIADQLVYAPFAIVAFFSYTTATAAAAPKVEAEATGSPFIDKLNKTFWPTFAADCTVWPLANVVNFRYIPLVYRASFTATVSLFWQMYLSAVAYFPEGGDLAQPDQAVRAVK